MKKIVTILILFIIIFSSNKVFAMEIEDTNIYIEAGNKKEVNLYANLPDNTVKVEFMLTFEEWDIPVIYKKLDGIKDSNPDGPSHVITLSEESSGRTLIGTISASVKKNTKLTKSSANIRKAYAIDSDGEKTELNSQELIINVGEYVNKNTNSTYNILKEIKSSIVNIEVKENVFEYTVNIKSDIDKLDLEGIAISDKYKVSISNQVISELEDNKIYITVSNNNEKQIYTINVKVIKDVHDVEIDDSEFIKDESYKSSFIIVIIVSIVVLIVGLIFNKRSK